jgi:hypothetical protein
MIKLVIFIFEMSKTIDMLGFIGLAQRLKLIYHQFKNKSSKVISGTSLNQSYDFIPSWKNLLITYLEVLHTLQKATF